MKEALVVKYRGEPVAIISGRRLSNTKQGRDFWADARSLANQHIRERAALKHTRVHEYTIHVDEVPADMEPAIKRRHAEYKQQVYDQVMEFASDPDCGQVRDFLDAVNIDPRQFAATAEYTVKVKSGVEVTASDLEAALEDGLEGFTGHEVYEVYVT